MSGERGSSTATGCRVWAGSGNDRGAEYWCLILLLLALTVDLVTPVLIWKGMVPAYSRWLSHAVVVAIMVGAYVRMMVLDRIPRGLWLIVWLSAVGIVVALLRGQSIGATLWGWWIMFQFPVLAVWVYLQPRWPGMLAPWLRHLCVAILAAEVVIQIGQYLTGEPPGDNLAGTFGSHGDVTLMLFVLFVLCLALGHWLATGSWKTVALVLALGSVSSVLGALKLFPFAVLLLGMASVVVYGLWKGQPGKLVVYALLMGSVAWAFFGTYNRLVSPARAAPPLESYLNIETLADYFGGLKPVSGSGAYSQRYLMGRNYAITYGWEAIQGDPSALLFGMGLGARGESRTLGTAGVGLLEGTVGLSTGTTLLVMMQESGLVGMGILVAAAAWVVVRLASDIREHPQSEAIELRYGLLLFSLFWPLWMWYTTVWMFRAIMLLYWASLGYVLAEPQLEKGVSEGARLGASSFHRHVSKAP
jgi:hypothetical protein